MINYVTYKISGEILSVGYCPDEDFQHQAKPELGIYALQGTADYRTQYVKSSQIIDKPPKPIGAYIFDYSSERWIPDVSEQLRAVRLQRNNLLAQSDWTDTYSAPARLGTEKYNQWQQYRQQLRDVTSQPDLYNIVWPTPPNP